MIDSSVVFSSLTRRRLMSGLAMTAGALTVRPYLAQAQSPTAPQESSTKAAQVRTSLHQEVPLADTPGRIYDILLDSKQFAACTGMPAEIDPKAGGAFSTFGGMIEGRNIELVSGKRLVQAWRPTHWDAGVFSIVRFDFKPQDARIKDTGTLVVLNHSSFPEGEFESLTAGWKSHYWEPLAKFLSSTH